MSYQRATRHKTTFDQQRAVPVQTTMGVKRA